MLKLNLKKGATILVILFTAIYTFSQEVLVLTEQSQVNSLHQNFPSGIVDRDLRIEGQGIQNLDSLVYLVRIHGILEIVDTDIDTLFGLHNLEYVTSLMLVENEKLTVIASLEKLEVIKNILYISNCPYINSIDKFPQLKRIGGIEISGDTRQLKKIEGFSSLETIETFALIDNLGVENISGFSNTEIGSVVLIANKSLKKINGFNGPSKFLDPFWLERYAFYNALRIVNNDSLEYVNVLNGVSFMDQAFITDNINLKNIRIGEKIEHLQSFYVKNCIELDTLIGVNNVKKVRSEINLDYNLELRHIEIFSQLEVVNYLKINDNHNITSLNGSFSNLKRVEELFSLAYTFWLEDIEEFSQVEYFGEINIHHNIRLGMCSIPSICNHIQSGRPTNITVYNKPGCKSINQVLSGCTTSSVNGKDDNFHVTIYPNPFTSELNIEHMNVSNLTIYNNLGYVIYQESDVMDTEINTSDWPDGVYYIRLEDQNKIFNTKIIKTH